MGVTAALMGVKMISDVMGTRQQYKAQEAAYKAQAEAAQQNANIAERQREQQAEAYAQKQGELNDRMRLARGQALAAAGASGATADGSVADILSSSKEQYEQDSLNLLQNQRNDSWSAYVNQVNYLNQADAYNTAAKNAVKQGRQKMFSTILGNAASIYGTGSDQGWWGKSGGSSEWYDQGFETMKLDLNPMANVSNGLDLVSGVRVGSGANYNPYKPNKNIYGLKNSYF
jgi:hypothetical protein